MVKAIKTNGKVIGQTYYLNRYCRTTDGGYGPVEVLADRGNGLTQVRDGIGGDEYPADPKDLKTIREATTGLIPPRTNVELVFRSHGKTFKVKRHNYQNYSLFQDGVANRSRWGTKDEILADMAHVLEFGQLPPADGSKF